MTNLSAALNFDCGIKTFIATNRWTVTAWYDLPTEDSISYMLLWKLQVARQNKYKDTRYPMTF